VSKIGRKPILVPPSVKVSVEGDKVVVKGQKGELSLTLHPGFQVVVEDGKMRVLSSRTEREGKALHGLTRALLNNMVKGVSEGYEKVLVLEGLGYRANLKGKVLELTLGYTNPVLFPVPDDVKIQVENQTTIYVRGIDKQKVGQVAALIRSFRPPDPYKGKGVRYRDEVIRRKAGKSGA